MDFLTAFSSADVAAILAVLGVFVFFLFILLVAVYVYQALALTAIAKKTKTENAWLAWIPIGNIFLMTQIAKVSGLWTLAILLAGIPAVGPFAVAAFSVWLWWKVAERRGFPGLYGLLTIVPIANLIMMGIIAWGKPSK